MIPNSGRSLHGRTLCEGETTGEAIVLTDTLGLWGGLDPRTGIIIDPRHPQVGTCLSGHIVLMPGWHGSSAGSTIVLETVRQKTSPLAWLLLQPNQILVVGAVIAEELYGVRVPVVLLDKESAAEIHDGDRLLVVALSDDAVISVVGPA